MLASHDNESFEILRANRVEQFGSAFAAALPVGPDDRNSAWLLVGQLDVAGQNGAHIGGVG